MKISFDSQGSSYKRFPRFWDLAFAPRSVARVPLVGAGGCGVCMRKTLADSRKKLGQCVSRGFALALVSQLPVKLQNWMGRFSRLHQRLIQEFEIIVAGVA